MYINYIALADIPSKNANALQIVQMCNAMVLNGHKVTLLIPNFSKSEKSLKEYYGIETSIRIIKIGKKQKNISKFQNLTIPIKLVYENFFIKKDIIITRNMVISLIFIILRIKHIIEIHDDISTSGKIISKIFKFFKLLNSSSIIKIVFITHGIKKFIMLNYKYIKNNFDVLPDATNIFNYKFSSLSDKKLNIGYFGSIYKSRGINTIIKLSLIDPNNDYYIYGGLPADVNKLHLKYKRKNLIIKSQIPYKEVKDEIVKMDVLLMPYTGNVTTTGNVSNIINFMSPMKMFDYLGSSKIILSANIPVLREVLKNNFNSILIDDYMNINSWLREISKIKFNKPKYLIIRKNALKTALENTWFDRAKKLLS